MQVDPILEFGCPERFWDYVWGLTKSLMPLSAKGHPDSWKTKACETQEREKEKQYYFSLTFE